MPTMYDIYHPRHCAGPAVLNASAEVSDWVGADSKRRSEERVEPKKLKKRHPAAERRDRLLRKVRGQPLEVAAAATATTTRPATLVCDAFVDGDTPDCLALPLKYQGPCESTVPRAKGSEWQRRRNSL